MSSRLRLLSELLLLGNVFLVTVFPRGVANAITLSNETDREALLAFKSGITDDPLGALSSWNEPTHFCQWRGVECGSKHQRVIRLQLPHLKLKGYLSPQIGNLSFLRRLALSNNSFIQEIPPEIGRLRRLQSLLLPNNSFRGEIPANLSSCSNLVQLALYYNKLVGKIPVELGSLSKLQYLNIRNNALKGGLPSSLGNLSSLQILDLTTNSLNGNIPTALGFLEKLEILGLGENNFLGTIPLAIFNMSSLIYFDVVSNNLQGNLPLDMGFTLPNLLFFSVSANEFMGSVPDSIKNLTGLEVFSASSNKFTGEVPRLEKLHKLRVLSLSNNSLGGGSQEADDLDFMSSLSNASSLEILHLSFNSFGGLVPESIGNLSTKLETLLLNSNELTGSIPNGISYLVGLNNLQMWSNHFAGNIPLGMEKLQNLRSLSLSSNKLSGNIPSSLGNLTLLMRLYLAENNLQGNIPSTLGNCTNLQLLNLGGNNLTGPIPPQVLGLTSLTVSLNLSHNSLTGPISTKVGNLNNLGEVDISHNLLSGILPSSLGGCTSLQFLYMDRNFFEGNILLSLSSLRGLRVLDISNNGFSGEIPKFLEDFNLTHLNLSFNNFEGPVPKEGIFKNSSAASVVGNSKLCGGMTEFQLPLCISSVKTGSASRLKVILPLVIGLLGVILLIGSLLFYWTRKSRKEFSSDSIGNPLLQLSYQSLKQATNEFSSTNLIGMGSFGSVYKGTLVQPDGTTIIAVKVLNLSHQGASKSFKAECEALRNIRHRNLVKVLTACSSVDFQGNDFKALVYEFMANGSLDGWLHPNMAQAESRKLKILQRLDIAIDVASALDYLHNHSQTPIVHCDLKPSNVLLDNDLVGHLGDFGLVRFLSTENHDSSTNQSASAGVRGSIGYTAPEYGMGSEVSSSGDMYSFGILLLEMFTGKRPTDDMFTDAISLHNFVHGALPEHVTEIVDPILVHENETIRDNDNAGIALTSMSSSHRIQACLTSVLRVGVACSVFSANERLNLAQAATELHAIRRAFLSNSENLNAVVV